MSTVATVLAVSYAESGAPPSIRSAALSSRFAAAAAAAADARGRAGGGASSCSSGASAAASSASAAVPSLFPVPVARQRTRLLAFVGSCCAAGVLRFREAFSPFVVVSGVGVVVVVGDEPNFCPAPGAFHLCDFFDVVADGGGVVASVAGVAPSAAWFFSSSTARSTVSTSWFCRPATLTVTAPCCGVSRAASSLRGGNPCLSTRRARATRRAVQHMSTSSLSVVASPIGRFSVTTAPPPPFAFGGLRARSVQGVDADALLADAILLP